jgi:nitroreductase
MRPESTPADLETIGESVPLLEGIRTTCAIRRFRPDPVPKALIRKVVEAGTFAPSGGNRQPWTFVAVTISETRAWIAEHYRLAFEAYIAPARAAAARGELGTSARRNVKSAEHLAATLANVPVHLFVAGWLRRNEPQAPALFPAIQNILLACRAVGLGACLTQLHLASGREIDAKLGLPPEQASIALVPIGWPAVAYKRPLRKPVDEVLHWERWEKMRN